MQKDQAHFQLNADAKYLCFIFLKKKLVLKFLPSTSMSNFDNYWMQKCFSFKILPVFIDACEHRKQYESYGCGNESKTPEVLFLLLAKEYLKYLDSQ